MILSLAPSVDFFLAMVTMVEVESGQEIIKVTLSRTDKVTSTPTVTVQLQLTGLLMKGPNAKRMKMISSRSKYILDLLEYLGKIFDWEVSQAADFLEQEHHLAAEKSGKKEMMMMAPSLFTCLGFY